MNVLQKEIRNEESKKNRTELTEQVNYEIRDNQLQADDWDLYLLGWELHWWVDAFNILFFKDTPAPVPVLTFESERVNTLGHYRIGRNDFGVRNQININRKHLQRPLFDLLSTLVHELVHAIEWTYLDESERTKNWYHTRKFRNIMKRIGIECNDKGQHTGINLNGPFYFHLRRHGVSFDSLYDISPGTRGTVVVIDPDKKKKKGKSKMLKWSCGCTNIRAAVQVQAICTACGNEFQLYE